MDFELGREGEAPPTLPNLDYKIEVGNSLLAPDPSGDLQPDIFRQQIIKDYFAAKEHYLRSHGEDKKQLHKHVEHLQAEIKDWARGSKGGAGFDWAVEFAEVFNDGGFDIVLANSPYVRQEGIDKDEKIALQQIFPAVYTGTADLYTYFYARAFQMLRQNGMLAFISSNTWMRAVYGAKLRTLLSTQMRLETMIDFGDLPVFGAIAYPVIVIAQKRRSEQTHTRMQTMRAVGVPLGEYVKGQIFYGIKTGFNTAFVTNSATRSALIAEDARSAEIIKPFLRGRDVKRWRINKPDLWLIFYQTW